MWRAQELFSSVIREGLPEQSPEGKKEGALGRSEERAFLVEGTASHKHSMFRAGQDGSQRSGADRGRGIVGVDETGGQLWPEPDCTGPCRPQEGH